MAYSAGSFTAGQQPTTAQWNQLWSNDAANYAAILALVSSIAAAGNAGTAGGTTNTAVVGTFRLTWGKTATVTNGSSTGGIAITYPVAYSAVPYVLVSSTNIGVDARQECVVNGETTSGFNTIVNNYGGAATATSTVTWFAIGVA